MFLYALITVDPAIDRVKRFSRPGIKLDLKVNPSGALPPTADLGFIGMRPGSLFVYRVRGSEYGSGFFRDSVITVQTLDTNRFAFCTFPSNQRYTVAVVEHFNFTDSTIVGDSLTPELLASIISTDENLHKINFVYVRDTSAGFAPYTYEGIRFFKRGATVGDTWTVLDTCVFAPFMRYDTIGDVDGDGTADSLRLVQAYARMLAPAGSLLRSVTPVVIRIKLTSGLVDSVYSLVVDSIDIQDSIRWSVLPDTAIVSINHPPQTYRIYYHPLYGDSVYVYDTTDSDARLLSAVVPKPDTFHVVGISPPNGSTVPPNTHVFARFNEPLDPRTVNDTMLWVNSTFRDFYFVIAVDTLRPLTAYHFYPDPSFSSSQIVKFRARSFLRDLWGNNLNPEDSTVFNTGSSVDLIPPIVKVLVDPDTSDLDTLVLYQPYTDTLQVFVQDPIPSAGITDAWIENAVGDRVMTLRPCDGSPSYSNPDTVCGLIRSTDLPQGIHKFYALASDYAGNRGRDSFFVQVVDTVSPFVVSTFPSDSATGVSNSTHIQITFNEPMDRTYFRPRSVVIRYGSTVIDSTGYSHFWATARTLLVYPSSPFPYRETVWVYVDSLRDRIGNFVRPDTFFFVTQDKEDVFIDFVTVSPDSVYQGDSVLVLAQASSGFPIRGGTFYLDGVPYDSAIAGDGAFDETVETLKVYVRTDTLSVGEHTVSVEAYNDYTTSSKATVGFSVLKRPALLEKRNVVVYPNPVKGTGRVRIVVGYDGSTADVDVKVEVWSMKAKRVFFKTVKARPLTTLEITLPDLAPDMYLLRVMVKDARVEKWFGVIR